MFGLSLFACIDERVGYNNNRVAFVFKLGCLDYVCTGYDFRFPALRRARSFQVAGRFCYHRHACIRDSQRGIPAGTPLSLPEAAIRPMRAARLSKVYCPIGISLGVQRSSRLQRPKVVCHGNPSQQGSGLNLLPSKAPAGFDSLPKCSPWAEGKEEMVASGLLLRPAAFVLPAVMQKQKYKATLLPAVLPSCRSRRQRSML